MLNIEELKKNRNLVNEIDWNMTSEKAVDKYLEWGAGWTRGNEFARSGDEYSVYFVLYDWERPYQVTLLKRSSKDVEEIAKIEVPEDMAKKSIHEFGKRPGVGVYPLIYELKCWLTDLINGPPVPEEEPA